ncbi:MAG: glycosyltransferase family 4 protein [Gammaproteobacteria bacterium]|jgi:glycosyltransferase involved in cell wall biosynthesis|nr:glycosyltransferase family 4 protein [Gammaproteobacteria bacterium]
MKICMIASRHTLDDARVIHKEAISLKNSGFDVSVILHCNSGYVYENNDGSVIAKGIEPNGKCKYKGLTIFGFPKRKGFFGKWKTYKEISGFISTLNADVYHAHEPDLSLAIAIRAKKILKKKGKNAYVIHDMHEYPPGEPYDRAYGIMKYIKLYFHIILDKYFVKHVDHIFTANSIVRGYILTLSYKKTVDVIYNGPILKLFPQTLPSQREKNSKLILCHEGSLPFDRGLKELVKVIQKFKDSVELRIIGDVFGDEKIWLEKEINKHGLENSIVKTGWLPYEKVGDSLKNCHIGLILFRDAMENRLAGPPNKLFNYMNAGIPVISVDFPEMRTIITEEECGILIKDQSMSAIEDSIENILKLDSSYLLQMGTNGQKAIKNRYSWEKMEKIIISTYSNFSD